MATPRGRRSPDRGTSRGRSQSARSNRSAGSRGSARGGRATGRGTRGDGHERAPVGGSNGPIYAMIGLGGLLVVILLVIVMSGGDKKEPETSEAPGQTDVHSPVKERDQHPPLTVAEAQSLNDAARKLDVRYDEAKRLKDEGFEAQRRGEVDVAQEKWGKAFDILDEMIDGMYRTSEPLGEERVDDHAPRVYQQIIGRWFGLRADILKHLKE